MKIFSQLESAQIQNVTADPTPTAQTVGRVIYRTDTGDYKICDTTPAWRTITLDSLDGTITFTGLVGTPASPSAGTYKVYFKNDGKPYYLDENGIELLLGSGSGSGSFNYIENGTGESDLEGWTVYANTAAATRPDNFGGTPNVGFTWTKNTVAPLVGDEDFLLTKPAANVQGNGIYYQFTAENGHLTIKHLLTMLSETSDLDDEDISFWLVSSSDSFAADFNVISPGNPDILANVSPVLKQFQFDNSDLDYRLCIHWNSTDTTAKTARFDSITLGPSPVPTSSRSPEYPATIQNNGTATILNDPRSFISSVTRSALGTVDVVYRPGLFSEVPNIIVGAFNTPGANREVYTSSETNLGCTVEFRNESGGVFADGDFKIQITSQDKETFHSTALDLSTLDVFVEAENNAGTAVTANVTDIPFNNTIIDRTSSWNGSVFTAPKTDYYIIKGNIRWNTNTARAISLYVGGSEVRLLSNKAADGFNEFSALIYLERKQQASIRCGTSDTLSADPIQHWITIKDFSSSKAILDTSTRAMSVNNTSGFSVPNSVWTKITGFAKSFDTHGTWSTVDDSFTPKVSGIFHFDANVFYTANATGQRGIRLRKNGGDTGFGSIVQASSAIETGVGVSGLIQLEPTDVLTIETIQLSGGGSLSLTTTSDLSTNLSIHGVK